MGVDIHMSIVKDGEFLAEDIFDGRNSVWFNNILKGGMEPYNNLPINYGYSKHTPDAFKNVYTKDEGYYGFCYINVSDFLDWFIKYNPHVDAGWVTKRVAWQIENQNYIPAEHEVQYELTKEDVVEDRVFVSFKNEYSCDAWLYNYIMNHIINGADADIIYCFDC